jgi:hypothetical protein
MLSFLYFELDVITEFFDIHIFDIPLFRKEARVHMNQYLELRGDQFYVRIRGRRGINQRQTTLPSPGIGFHHTLPVIRCREGIYYWSLKRKGRRHGIFYTYYTGEPLPDSDFVML